MSQELSSTSEPEEYAPLPSGGRESPEWRAARELDQRAQDADGRLKLGCCLFWLSDGGYLLTSVPPMGDVRGSESWMTIYTAEHLVTIRGENLHLLIWAMKEQRVDSLRAATESEQNEHEADWAIHSITAEVRNEE